MVTLLEDLKEIYNSLVIFSDSTIKSPFPKPIKVWFEKESRLLVFEQSGKSARLWTPNYYCLDLEEIEGEKNCGYLLPEDYDYLMYNLQTMIFSGELIKERTCLSPENFGFDIFYVNLKEAYKGPTILGSARFISGKSWLFKWRTKRKYNL